MHQAIYTNDGGWKVTEATPELPASYLLKHDNFTLIYTADKIDLEQFL